MTPDNFLFLEPLIKDALRARLDPRVFVLSAADLAGVAEDHQPTITIALIELFEACELRREAALARRIDDQEDLACKL